MGITETSQTKQDIWSMPWRGLPWCDCGVEHELTAEIVHEFALELRLHQNESVTHRQLVKLISEVWDYAAVCRFFHLAVNDSAVYVRGKVAEQYTFAQAVDITGYFSKTWQGCPDEACQGEE